MICHNLVPVVLNACTVVIRLVRICIVMLQLYIDANGLGETIPIPFNDLFPSTVAQGAETFHVDFDPDEGL